MTTVSLYVFPKYGDINQFLICCINDAKYSMLSTCLVRSKTADSAKSVF